MKFKFLMFLGATAFLALSVQVMADEIEGRNHTYLFGFSIVEDTNNVLVPVPDVSTTFHLRRRESILATFCAETQVHGTLGLRILIDGSILIPGEINLDEEFEAEPSSEIRSHCFTFVAENLPRGDHAVEVVMRKLGTPPGVGFARMFRHSLVLEIL